jgi:DNA-binding winged helix-turn-helix (wHTH) protein
MGNALKQLLEFGPFCVGPEQRLLFRDQQAIPLPSKTFDLLLVLVQHSGQVVLKDDLMKTLWPDAFVEESNLGQHVFQLRKALGDRSQDSSYIVTVPGGGYRFAQSVNILRPEEELVVERHTRSHMVIDEVDVSAPRHALPSGRRWAHKNIALVVLAGLVATGYFTGRAYRSSHTASPERMMLAVLPFRT